MSDRDMEHMMMMMLHNAVTQVEMEEGTSTVSQKLGNSGYSGQVGFRMIFRVWVIRVESSFEFSFGFGSGWSST